MYKIEKSKFIQAVLLCFAWLGCFLLVSLGFFLGFDITLFSIAIYISSLILLALVYFIVYLILRRFSRKTYLFGSGKIDFLNGSNIEKTIQVSDIKKILYIKAIWILLSQMGASYLMIEHIKGNEVIKEYISMSKRDVKKVGITLGINIEIT